MQTLYVGLDDSNHAGDSEGDILVATFSFDSRDSLVQKFKNRKDYQALSNWLGQIESPKDYRFGIILGDTQSTPLRTTQPNLPLAAPYLIEDFMLTYQGPEISQLSIYLDGIMKPTHKKYLKDYFNKYNKILVDNFIKIQNIHNCPKVIYMADILASELYSMKFPQLNHHPKRVNLPDEEMLKVLSKLQKSN